MQYESFLLSAAGRKEEKRKKTKGVKVPWSTEQKNIETFGEVHRSEEASWQERDRGLSRAEPVLRQRLWRNVKDFCRTRMLTKDRGGLHLQTTDDTSVRSGNKHMLKKILPAIKYIEL